MQILRRPIKTKLQNAQKYSPAAIALHNYLQQIHNAYYCPTDFIDSKNSKGTLKEDMWRDILGSRGVAGLQEIRNVRKFKISTKRIGTKRDFERLFYEREYAFMAVRTCTKLWPSFTRLELKANNNL